ncbi:MAG: hypothetical protein IJ459_05195 [Clostridia bacterium]|nr:hypothetical protein [Clostridia bacterium]
MYDRNLITEKRLCELKAARDKMRSDSFLLAAETIGKSAAEGLEYLYSIYNEGMYLWLAGLWEPEIGAFYYSNSARDTEGYLPDIESTAQALNHLVTAGIFAYLGEGSYGTLAPDYIRYPVLNFALSLQDPDGYFYHPQWGKNIGVTRRGRDLSWSTQLIKAFGGTPKYTTPIAGTAEAKNLLPEHLQSLDKFREYIYALDLKGNSYWVGNYLQAQALQIKAAGQEYVDTLLDWYRSNQNPENGLWTENITYSGTNGLMKICLTYSSCNAPLPYAERAFDSCIEVLTSNGRSGMMTSYYNPWTTLRMIIDNVRAHDSEEKAQKLTAKLCANTAAMAVATADKVVEYRKADGSYSYSPDRSSHQSQGAPVAVPNTPEGDVNGNCLASTGIIGSICSTLGIPRVPLFCKEDGKLFFELLENSYPSKKIYPRPEKFFPD